jgi:hypothetical protein
VNFITSLLNGDNRTILAADINEHAVNWKLVKELKRIGMLDAYFRKFNLPGLASYITGSALIDGVWITGNVTLTAVSILAQKFSMGDHRVILMDFNFDQIVERRVRICTLQMRRLICNNHKSIMKYNETVWQLLQFHNVLQRLKALEDSFDSIDIDLWYVRLNILDKQVTDILLYAKNNVEN